MPDEYERLIRAADGSYLPLGEGEREVERIGQSLAREFNPERAEDAILAVPYLLLLTIKADGEEHDLPYKLKADVARVRREARGGMTRLTRVLRPDGTSLVRGLVSIPQQGPGGDYWQDQWLDLTDERFGQIVEAWRAEKKEPIYLQDGAPMPGRRVRPVLDPRIPRWAGSHTFAGVLACARQIANSLPLERGKMDHPPRQLLSITEATVLGEAHVVCVDPDQVAVLPEWESDEEVIEYALDAELPFEAVYLDFTGPGGLAPFAGESAAGAPLKLSGAIMFRAQGGLVVAPVGWPVGAEASIGREWPVSEFETMGWFVFNRVRMRDETKERLSVATRPLLLEGLDMGADPICVETDSACNTLTDDGVEKPDTGLPGWALLPFTRRGLLETSDSDLAVTTIIYWADALWQMAKKSLAALSIVEAEEVILVDAPMEKRDRRRAEKRGWPIAKQVVIRPSRRRLNAEPNPHPQEAHYSHQFWVRGHYKHFPLGTRLADTRPDLVRACPRLDLATNCGFCRRVWTPPFIKGPEGTPLVLKTLVKHRKKAS